MPTGWPPDGLRVASGWPRGGRNPPWSFFASVDTQPARGNRALQGIDPGFRLPPTNICGHFLRKAPFCWALSKRHSRLAPFGLERRGLLKSVGGCQMCRFFENVEQRLRAVHPVAPRLADWLHDATTFPARRKTCALPRGPRRLRPKRPHASSRGLLQAFF